MVLKWINKNNYGIFATLFLVILLSQSRVFDLLFVTAIGRAILILFILGISCTSKILGTILVFFIIIMFNHSNIGFLEGFNLNSMTSQNTINNTNISSPVNSVSTNSKKNTKFTKETFIGREGFNNIDRENTILRGKNSNQLQVLSNSPSSLDNIEPTDNLVFSSVSSRF
jgi:hypothetical protein